MGQPKIVEQNSKCLFADSSLPDLLMAVELRTARRFGVVAVPYLDAIQADSRIEMLQGLV